MSIWTPTYRVKDLMRLLRQFHITSQKLQQRVAIHKLSPYDVGHGITSQWDT